MHWRHIKWRAPWQKRHLSVLEIFRAEEAAREKNTAIRRSRDKATHHVTRERHETPKSSWNRCKRSIYYLRSRSWRVSCSECFEYESVDMSMTEDTHNEEIQEHDNAGEPWQGDYTHVLADYGIQ